MLIIAARAALRAARAREEFRWCFGKAETPAN